MRVLVCYPIKTLVGSFIPDQCEVLTVESENQLTSTASIFKPEAVIMFTEAFSRQIWEWVPEVLQHMPQNTPKIFVSTNRDYPFVQKIVEETITCSAYVLPPGLTYAEIKEKVADILGLQPSLAAESIEKHKDVWGKVFTLLSYGSAGVTTFCVNYPILLAKKYPASKIAVIDMNLEKPDLSKYFQLKELSLYRPDLLDLDKAEKRDWLTAFTQSKAAKNLYYASGACKWKSYEISTLLKVLRARFDYIYLDWGFCFPESEGLPRLLKESEQNLFFVRADPFSLEHANQWIQKWQQEGVDLQLLVSHFDQEEMGSYRIKENMQVYGILPRVPDGRVSHSHQRRSVLVEEFLPPKNYKNSLLQLVDAEKRSKGAALC
ncbi:MAG: hypothetical protein ACM32O_09365 [Clostridia bacterium]